MPATAAPSYRLISSSVAETLTITIWPSSPTVSTLRSYTFTATTTPTNAGVRARAGVLALTPAFVGVVVAVNVEERSVETVGDEGQIVMVKVSAADDEVNRGEGAAVAGIYE